MVDFNDGSLTNRNFILICYYWNLETDAGFVFIL